METRENDWRLSVRLKGRLAKPIREYCDRNERSLSWAIHKILTYGWPIFQANEPDKPHNQAGGVP